MSSLNYVLNLFLIFFFYFVSTSSFLFPKILPIQINISFLFLFPAFYYKYSKLRRHKNYWQFFFILVKIYIFLILICLRQLSLPFNDYFVCFCPSTNEIEVKKENKTLTSLNGFTFYNVMKWLNVQKQNKIWYWSK